MQFEIIIIPTRQRFNFFQETEQSVYTFETPRLELAAPLSDDVTLHYPEDEKEKLLDIVENLDDDVRNINSEQLKQEIGVSCAEIIENITLSNVNFEDFD